MASSALSPQPLFPRQTNFVCHSTYSNLKKLTKLSFVNLQRTCAKFSCRNNSFTKKKIKDCTLRILFCNQTIQLEITSRNRSISDDNSDESSYKLKEGKSRSDLKAEFAHFLPFGQSVFVPVDERSYPPRTDSMKRQWKVYKERITLIREHFFMWTIHKSHL